MSKQNIIVGDIGATKCAAAIVEYDNNAQELSCKKKLFIKLKDHQSLHELFHNIESQLKIKMSDANAICIGAAGMYDLSLIHI